MIHTYYEYKTYSWINNDFFQGGYFYMSRYENTTNKFSWIRKYYLNFNWFSIRTKKYLKYFSNIFSYRSRHRGCTWMEFIRGFGTKTQIIFNWLLKTVIYGNATVKAKVTTFSIWQLNLYQNWFLTLSLDNLSVVVIVIF